MQSKGNISFSDTQQIIDRQQAKIRSRNERQLHQEQLNATPPPQPPLWQRILDRLRR